MKSNLNCYNPNLTNLNAAVYGPAESSLVLRAELPKVTGPP